MLKLGIVSDEISQDFEYALSTIKELGAEYVELRSIWDKNILEISPSELKKAKELIKKNDLKVSVIASPLFKCHLVEKETKKPAGDTFLAQDKSYSEHLKDLEHFFELAKMFNTNIVRVFSFWREGDLSEEILEEILQRFQVPIEKAEKENIILALENEHTCFIGNGKEAQRFLARVSSKNVGLIWDLGNAYFAREVPYPDGYELVKDRIVHVHVKDAGKDRRGRPIWLPVGKGDIDFKGQFEALNEVGFSGILSLETHYVPESGSKEEGTRESFSGIKLTLAMSEARGFSARS